APEPGAGQAERERERDEPLLGAVMQIADKPAPLGVAGLDDPETRRTQLLQLKPGLGLETLILKRQPSRRGHLLGERRLSEQPRPVRQKRYLLPAADDGRYLSGQLNRPAARVGKLAAGEWVGKHERPIMEHAGEDVAQAPRRGRPRQPDHQPRERRAGAPSP